VNQLKADQVQLIKDATTGDIRARKELYTQYYGYAMGVCLRYAQHRHEAEEIVNDGFLKVFEHLPRCKNPAAFKGWMRRIMVNAAIDYFRRYQKFRRELSEDARPDLPAGEETFAQLSAEDLLRLVQALPDAYRLVFNLYAIEGYSHDEIAAQTGIAASTSRSNLTKARARLRQMLAHQDELSSYER
jgi:RNA polymerase sigma-70 factor (ECF subfamily)